MTPYDLKFITTNESYHLELDDGRWCRKLQPNHQDLGLKSDPLESSGRTGGSLEYALDICNAASTDCWLNVPHQADDAYVTQMAQLVKTRLNSDLKVYVEYSNEVWNGVFGSCDPAVKSAPKSYIGWKAVELGYCETITNWCSTQPSSEDPYSSEQPEFNCVSVYHLKRSLEIFKLFEDVFGEGSDRVINVIAWQTGGTWHVENMLEWASDPESFTDNQGVVVNLNPHGVAVEAISLAPYIGGNIGNDIEPQLGTITPEEVLQLLENEIPVAQTKVQGYVDLAEEYGIPQVIAYEGGQHLVGVGGSYQNNQELTDLLVEVNRLPGMEQIYDAYYDMWFGTVGSEGIFATFQYITAATKYGSWGNLEFSGQNPCNSEEGDPLAPKWISSKGFTGVEVC